MQGNECECSVHHRDAHHKHSKGSNKISVYEKNVIFIISCNLNHHPPVQNIVNVILLLYIVIDLNMCMLLLYARGHMKLQAMHVCTSLYNIYSCIDLFTKSLHTRVAHSFYSIVHRSTCLVRQYVNGNMVNTTELRGGMHKQPTLTDSEVYVSWVKRPRKEQQKLYLLQFNYPNSY
jgi:hypothetical protein